MTSKYLVVMCVAMLLAGLLGVGGVALTQTALPPAPPPSGLAWDEDPPASMVDDARSDALVALESRAMSLLASRGTVQALTAAVASVEPSAQDASSSAHPGREVVRGLRKVHESARGTAVVAIVLFGILALSGLLGLGRLAVRGVTLLTCALLALAGGGGVAMPVLGLAVNTGLVVVAAMLCILALFAQLVSTNLMPNATHPMVVKAERQMTVLSPAQRRRHVAVRAMLGATLSAMGVLGTLASLFWFEGPVVTVFVGTFVSGLFVMVLPVIAAARVSVR